MTQTALHSTPRARAVAREQLRAVGLSLRTPALVATALAALATTLVAVDHLRGGAPVRFSPEHQMLPGIVGLLLPIAVWKGEERFGAGFLWTLPVDRRLHALARVAAGWAWLMGAVALFVLWLLGLALVTGGGILEEATLHYLPSFASPPPEGVEPAVVRSMPWRPSPLLWAVPFTAATGAYLLSSALALGVRHPLRWIVGPALGLLLVHALGAAASARWLADLPALVLETLFLGPYGLDALFTARTESLKIEAILRTTGEPVVVWRGLPDLADWATATLLWTLAGLAAVWAASRRHRENRRA